MAKQDLEKYLSYWAWFFDKDDGCPGVKVLLNRWALVSLIVGGALAYFVTKPVAEVSQQVLLPMIGVLVGLTFAWGGNAQALIQTEEIRLISKLEKGSTKYFVGYYQTAILLILISLASWMFASFDVRVSYGERFLWVPNFLEALLYALTFMTFIECWAVVDSARKLLLARELLLDRGQSKALPDGSRPGEDT